MDIWEKIGKTASQTYKYTADKTSKLAKEMKLKSQIQEDKDKIEEEYTAIGRKIYGKYRAWEIRQGTDMAQKIAEQANEDSQEEPEELKEKTCLVDIHEELKNECSKIDALATDAHELKQELLKLKDLKQCEHCHIEIEVDSNYCSNCGHKQNQ